MNKPQAHNIDAIRALNGLHVAWIYFSHDTRKKYKLEKKYACYHADINVDFVLRLEKELDRLHFKAPHDYCVQECAFGEWNIYTLCLTDKTSRNLEKLGVQITEKLAGNSAA